VTISQNDGPNVIETSLVVGRDVPVIVSKPVDESDYVLTIDSLTV
jgi:hypothetical protein